MTDLPRDPGLALERTTLAWHRTGLSSVAVGAISLHGTGRGGFVLATLLLALGCLAYAAGSATPAGPRRLRLMSVGVTAAAVIGVILTIVG